MAKLLRKETVFGLNLKQGRRHIEDRVAKMSTDPSFGPRVERSVQLVLEMISDFRYDEASLFLFNLNKLHVEEWGYVKDRLIKLADRSQLSALATIIDCSARPELSSCNAVIPGLSQYTNYLEDTELFD